MTIKYDKQTKENFKILKDLNWPTEHYRVFGGGIMSALGLKPWRDIDLIVSEEFFEVVREEYGGQYWYSTETHLPIHFNNLPIELGRFPVDLERNHPGLFNLNSFWNDYVMIEEVPFILMRHTHTYKLNRKNSKYVEVEEKDLQHIKLIEDYLTISSFGY